MHEIDAIVGASIMTPTRIQEHLATLLDLRKFTYRELCEMERAGIIEEDQHVELLGGQLVVMTVNPPHAAAVSHLNRRFNQVFADRVQVITQSPLRLSDDLEDENLPQPDVMLVAGPEKVYADHPRPADVYLLVEVSDSTLAKDRTIKLPLYAACGIPELWIVNLVDQQIEVYTEPHGDDYLTRVTYALTGRIAPLSFPDDAHPWLPDAILDLLET
ncbi:MAG TPA: Uma2 family endonuclease [Candidatus Entotheonella sp.]